MKDPKKDCMVQKGGKTIVIDKSKEKEYLKKGWSLAESTEVLEEAADFEKMSNELLKKKKLGIEFEKAAAFARVMFMNSSLSVQDKAMKGLLTLIKGIDDLTVKTTLIKILKDNGFKVKGGRVMREELDEAKDDDWVVVKGRKVVRTLKNPKNNKAPRNWQKSSDETEVIRVSKAKKMGIKVESVELDEALQSVTKIKFDYKDTMPKNAKPSDVGGLKQDWNNDRTAVRSAVKPLGGLVTDSEAPSRTNKFVGTLSVGTRGDASKLSNSAIQKAVKSKGAEIQNNQFMSESVDLEEGKMKEFHDYIDQGKSAQWIAKKMGLDMRTVKELMADMKESVELDEQNTIELAKDIVKTKSAKKGLDMQTANLIVQVYNKVNDVNKKKMEKMNPKQLGHAVWKMTGKN